MTSYFACPWKETVIFFVKVFFHWMEIITSGTKQNVWIKYRAGLVFFREMFHVFILFPLSQG